MPPAPFPCLILAGGAARRMGGRDKALLPLQGKSLLGHVLAGIAPQVGEIALNAAGPAARYASFGLPVLPDSFPGQAGPLAGVLTGLDWIAGRGHSHLLTVAVDSPRFPADLAQRLGAALGPEATARHTIALACSPDETGRLRRHPTFGLWPLALRPSLRAALEAGCRKVGAWAETQELRLVPFPGRSAFLNINTPEELARAEADWQKPGAQPGEARKGLTPGPK